MTETHRQPFSTEDTYYAPITTSPPDEDEKVHRQVSTETFYGSQGPVIDPLGGQGTISQLPSESHMGIDFGAAVGTPVVAPTAGMVSRIQRTPGKGYGLAVFMIDLKTGLEVTLAHLGNIMVKIGQVLRPGQQIGTVGQHPGGSHLHLEIGTAGPDPFFGKMTEAGAVDPTSYLAGAIPATASMAGLSPATPDEVSFDLTDSAMMTAGLGPINTLIDIIPTIPDVEPFLQGAGIAGMGAIPSNIFGQVQTEAENDEDPTGFFSAFERMGDKAGEATKRAGFIAAGLLIVLVGLIVMIYSYRADIAEGAAQASRIIKGGAKAAAVAGTGGAAAPIVAGVSAVT